MKVFNIPKPLLILGTSMKLIDLPHDTTDKTFLVLYIYCTYIILRGMYFMSIS